MRREKREEGFDEKRESGESSPSLIPFRWAHLPPSSVALATDFQPSARLNRSKIGSPRILIKSGEGVYIASFSRDSVDAFPLFDTFLEIS